nr:hypothetical protein Ade03nite_53970 [Actinoplanes derwentensis]
MSSDPAPGDPDEIEAVARRYSDIGEAAEKALEVLKRDGAIAAGRGSAMDKLREKVGDDLPDKLAKTARSYQDAAAAYRAYRPRIEEAQQTLDRAVDQAREASAQVSQAVTALPGAVAAKDTTATTRAEQDAEAGAAGLSAARGLAEQALSMRQAAERTCADALDRAADEAVPERDFFQKIRDFFADFPFVKILLGILIAAVAVFFPVAGALLAGALFALDQITAIATGQFSLGDFAVGLIGIIPGGSALRIGGAVAKTGGTTARVVPTVGRTVDGPITDVPATIVRSKPIGEFLDANRGDIVRGALKEGVKDGVKEGAEEAAIGFAEGAGGEAVRQVAAGEPLDARAIAEAGGKDALAAGATGFAGGAIIGGLLGGGKAAGKAAVKKPKLDEDTTPRSEIPVKTAPESGGSRSLDSGPPVSPERDPDSPDIDPDGAVKRPGAGDFDFRLIEPGLEDVDLVLESTHPDGTELPVFRDAATGERGSFDFRTGAFRKVGDSAPLADSADFSKAPEVEFTRTFFGPRPDGHFLVRGFEGQPLDTVGDRTEIRAAAGPDNRPVLVPTSEFTIKDQRAKLDEARIAQIIARIEDNRQLPPIKLSPGDLSLSDGNHRIEAAKRLNLPFIPVQVV